MRLGKYFVVVIGLVLLAGCGSTKVKTVSPSSSSPSIRIAAPCSDVLKPGEKADAAAWKNGCEDGNIYMATTSVVCKDGRTLNWNNYAWGIAGDVVHTPGNVNDPAFKATLSTCR
jgi:hypothetical protein